jgi:hypothetical protein
VGPRVAATQFDEPAGKLAVEKHVRQKIRLIGEFLFAKSTQGVR